MTDTRQGVATGTRKHDITPKTVPHRESIADSIRVLDGPTLRDFARQCMQAAMAGTSVRLMDYGHGVKFDAGNGWSPVVGRTADRTGH